MFDFSEWIHVNTVITVLVLHGKKYEILVRGGVCKNESKSASIIAIIFIVKIDTSAKTENVTI